MARSTIDRNIYETTGTPDGSVNQHHHFGKQSSTPSKAEDAKPL